MEKKNSCNQDELDGRFPCKNTIPDQFMNGIPGKNPPGIGATGYRQSEIRENTKSVDILCLFKIFHRTKNPNHRSQKIAIIKMVMV